METTPAVSAGRDGSSAVPSGGYARNDLPEALTPEQLAAQWEAEKPPAAGALANVGSSLVVLGVGVGALILSVAMGLGTPGAPQPGLWPFMISCVVVALGLFQLILGRRNRDGEKFTRMSFAPLTGLATLAAMVALMPMIGFEIPALVLCIIWMRFLGGETWRSTLVVSALVVASFYGIFVLALGTSIPHLF
ncbi:tripartite tricarboxylate transporter TctB family protein [Pseudarthrobacter sp. NamE5]|uniref:tripartite tricarboxylate transporter TctB family protein n=1 Tax=Pseudarthrobacter sp. NamE5 TaxID=2576839 RepID=UPI00110BFA84|nr:tripartite tricarboxylate transporter TctB family protein [Pseudarthrobacter sp. NamE5]TLM88052.1 tripartite tricarboxylate transporter TctB family protein [Pseudarthrobacter sp. NamE5]